MTARDEALRRIAEARATAATILDLGDLPLDSLPDELGDLPALRILGLGTFAHIGDDQQFIWDFEENRHPQSFTDFSMLRELPLLRCLSLAGCKSLANLHSLPDLPSLQELHLACCESLISVDGVQRFRALQRLMLSSCISLKDLTGLKELLHLSELDIRFCKSMRNVDIFQHLNRLRRLALAEYEAPTDFSFLKHLRQLQSLRITRCQSLTSLDCLKGFRYLRHLDLNGCGSLTDVDGLRDHLRLRSLSLNNCSGVPLFAPLRNLLPTLDSLRIFRCRFTDLDPALCGTNLLVNSLRAVRAHYADAGYGLRTDEEVKVFVLGNGGVGKTELCRRLRGEPFVENGQSTLGIEVSHISVTLPGHAAPVRLNLWDFGGQDIYHGTHHLFLHEQAVFVLMWTPDTETGEFEEADVRMRQRPLAYWLDYVRSLAGSGNPVLLVQGKCDRDGAKAPVPLALPEDFSSLSRLEFSAKQDDKLQRLRAALERATSDVLDRHPVLEVPVGRVRLAQSLRAMLQGARTPPETKRRRILGIKAFRILCEENGEIDMRYWREALTFLHHRGVVYWRWDMFRGRIILDQSWALKAIYALFNLARRRPGLFPGGRFTRDALAGAWKKHTEAAQRTFLRMMESCGICFGARPINPGQYPEKWEYIAPELLPEWDSPDVQRQIVAPEPKEAPAARAEVGFDFLHEGFLRRFLSWLGSHVGDRAVYWKYGCWFFDPKTDVRMKIATTDGWKEGLPGTLTLEGWGPHATRWLDAGIKALQTLSPIQAPKVERTSFEAYDRVGERLDDNVTPDAIMTGQRAGIGLSRIAVPTPGRFVKGTAVARWKGSWVLVQILLGITEGNAVSQRPLAKELKKRTGATYSPNTVGNYLHSLEDYAKRELFQWPDEDHKGNPTVLRPGAAKGLKEAERYLESQLDIVFLGWRKTPWAKLRHT